MDEAFEIWDYLPTSFKTSEEEKYLSFLWKSFETNYSTANYQFSFLAYHMIMMSFVYFSLWKIKTIRSEDFKNALIGFDKGTEINILKSTSPFVFSNINERKVFRFLKIIGCE